MPKSLPFPDNHFDVVSVAFGLRNMTHKDAALREMCRVLKPNGKLLVLEFSKVAKPLGEGLRLVFLQHLAESWARWVAGDARATNIWPSPFACTPAKKNSKP